MSNTADRSGELSLCQDIYITIVKDCYLTLSLLGHAILKPLLIYFSKDYDHQIWAEGRSRGVDSPETN